MAQLVGKDFARCNVVAVSKATRNHENLITVELTRLSAQAVDVHPLRVGAGTLKCKFGFGVTISAGSSQDHDPRGRHSIQRWNGKGRSSSLPRRYTATHCMGSNSH